LEALPAPVHCPCPRQWTIGTLARLQLHNCVITAFDHPRRRATKN